MPVFTNFATLSYNRGATNSNTVTGELLETLSIAKTAAAETYTVGDNVTYIVSLVNSGPTAITGLTLTDDLGGYPYAEATVYPLAYREGSLRFYVNGVLQPVPAVSAGAPLVISGVNIPAGGSAMLVYEASVTGYAPPDAEGTITNTVTVTGGGLSAPLTVEETISALARAALTISKAICPTVVTENGQLTYTLVIANSGSAPASVEDNVVLTDTFDPILDPITVTYNGAPWTEGVNYAYDETTGLFTTLPGQITVPAASFTRGEDGTWVVTPGAAVITVTGTV